MNEDKLNNSQQPTEHIDQQQIYERPDGYGVNTGECGDTIEIFLAVQDNCISDAAYATNGCMFTHLCGLAVVELVKTRNIERAWKIKPEHVIAAIPDLPTDHYHCAELAAGALYRALTDVRNHLQKPWAKLYRTTRS